MPHRARLAARNNAEWCDAVSRAHGATTRFGAGFWVNPGDAPPYYPNLVTLTAEDVGPQREEIAALIARRPGALGIKDSFATLNLSSVGLTTAFEAEWLWLAADTPAAISPGDFAIGWTATASDLADWERAWAGAPVERPVFPPAILADPRLAFLAVIRDGVTIGGAALNRYATVLGISNVFMSPEADPASVLASLIAAARHRHPNLPLVGYEHGESLALFRAAGFQSVGPLRVWVR
ncbi:hypothetical protein SAMN02745157_2068 [Kaistia soli DSM 19436]|uniref:N-acetyltransferase domain-containing protein n=1 Tax=Kaistia soli DSM 19436 TaxID=1122133 RepID=A0A1M5AAG3_9HYPH|nr:hypothetical protein [Kaistia soli]SHF27259.1 hypothetical protein SAMN02745157_2068 [Kaistia soli DSM 19436]